MPATASRLSAFGSESRSAILPIGEPSPAMGSDFDVVFVSRKDRSFVQSLLGVRSRCSVIRSKSKKPLALWAVGFLKWGFPALPIKKFLPPSQVFKRVQLSRPHNYLDKEFLQRKYVVERLSTTELAALTFSSKTTILKYLKLHGIPVRASGKNVRPVRSVGFGQHIVNRQVVAHRKESELIEKMRSLRAEGLSYWKIADVLNAWKVPTKTRK